MSKLSRRAFLQSASALTLVAIAPAVQATTGEPFSRAEVIARAKALAERPYKARNKVPDDWLAMNYDQYRSIQFDVDKALWADTVRSYNVDFFLPGLYFERSVQINAVENGIANRVPFDMHRFKKHPEISPDLSEDGAIGYSGLRLRTNLDDPDHPGKKTEFCVFQGASYFRAIAKGNVYGLSARGLALKTGDAEGEEFPEFISFWLEAPGPQQDNMVVHALMDSPSVTGAYRFDIMPGNPCVMDVEATLFARTELTHAGLAPLTSMFLFDATNHQRFDDFRPAVHDSEGLLIRNGNGEVIWRPLANPTRLQVSSFVDENPAGFGLIQRSRDLSDFDDLEAHYHRRPSLWVEPKGNWGAGAVTLVEIPADKEIYDNIVAYWRPRDPYSEGSMIELDYRLTWGDEPTSDLPRVIKTASGAKIFGDPGRLMVIDFDAHPIFEADPESFEIHITSPQLETSPGILERNPETGGMRLVFSFAPEDLTHVEFRAMLRKDGAAASEVWLYRWTV
ncbi:glucan biosynthesis protein [Arenibacterium sp. LLYu02]|uniref:glucan biosynthesis protein n=1 Tax=Arenibacterium sp. LLYu02 TaxID=3404132 RepID=UPI003B21FA9B